jgi:hypothetical protein
MAPDGTIAATDTLTVMPGTPTIAKIDKCLAGFERELRARKYAETTLYLFRVVYFPELKLGEARSVAKAWAERKNLRITIVDRKVGTRTIETIELTP